MLPSRVLVVGLVLLCVVGGAAHVGGPPVASATATSATATAPQTATTVGSCTEITKPGRYVLAHDIHNGKAAISTGCIKIRTDDVVFDGGGHTLDGYGVSDTSGVHVDGASNVTVRNLRTKDWNRGVYVQDSSAVTVRDVVTFNNAIGIGVTDADARLVNNTVRDGLRGLVLADAWDDDIHRNRIHHNDAIDIYAPMALVNVFGVQFTVGPPLDPDGDGRYEDVSGNGKVGVVDAASLPIVAAAETVGFADIPEQQRTALDFDGDGNFDHGDVMAYAGLTPSE
ncbi:NosD domain-containing protein [Haladaptatus sp. DYF46]|uniref:NosD domain-containing protein n=1 Tax=Haladaptatus sp. DYF46 TaxID=2886041 RepID=UPI001E533848|nr:NosD domain-containing protein [Haladaptatus sp. DYF46]